MIAHKKEFSSGVMLMVAFIGVFAVLLSPVFNGKNGLDYMDNLYNSISKNSSYYIPPTMEKAKKFVGTEVTFTIKTAKPEEAGRMVKLLQTTDARVSQKESTLTVSGDLGKIVGNMLADADVMFKNDGKAIASKYGYGEKQALYDWYALTKAMAETFQKESKIKEYNMIYKVQTKALEPAYNYYGIQAESISNKLGIVVFSLAGYVAYTLWFGFAILFMFEGWGLKLDH